MRLKSILKNSGFTMIEVVIVVVVIGIVSTVSARVLGTNINSQRYRATLREMGELKRGLIGDEDIIKGKQRVDFGYVGNRGAFPTNFGQLAQYFPVNADFQNDQWDNAYVYSGGGANPVTVTSRGADGAAGGTGINEDLVLALPRANYVGNIVYVVAVDARGTILRGDDTGDANFQIQRVSIYRGGPQIATVTSPTENTTFVFNNIAIGAYTLRAYPADGGGGGAGNTDWRPFLKIGRAHV